MSNKPNNRIIIVGNGFDLALGLKTSYTDFLFWYIKSSCVNQLKEGCVSIQTALFEIEPQLDKRGVRSSKSDGIQGRIEQSKSISAILEILNHSCIINYKSEFCMEIVKEVESFGWVDIEQKYFNTIRYIYLDWDANSKSKINLQKVNDAFNEIKNALDIYIKEIQGEINYSKFVLLYKPLMNKLFEHNIKQKQIDFLVLNFNYTNTFRDISKSVMDSFSEEEIQVVDIHGQVNDKNNPIIFGYGDDTSPIYKEIEAHEERELRRHIKSFYYPNTDHYKKLLGYLEGGKFDVHIIGHSCGMSDKTLLNTIFEHPDCVEIKNYHRGTIEEDFDKRLEISRHFKDKPLMRERIANYDPQAVIPQMKND